MARGVKNRAVTVRRVSGKPSVEELHLWPDTLRSLSSALSAGIDYQRALASVLTGLKSASRRAHTRAERGVRATWADIADVLSALMSAHSAGYDPAHACSTLALRREHSRQRCEELTLCLGLSYGTGAPLADTLRSCADYAEAAIDARLARESALAAPAATARLLSTLPFVGLGLGALLGADPLGVLFGSIPGALCGAAGLYLGWAGYSWSARLVHSAEVKSL
ncbi:MAG: type II secretion system F family protein [Rothia sp. (in: high G+C Gram-positive bacteria)]|uniref:type II secretion system F family protein n=1 Tax=Rothia sp. (in: high G+C Gram-positive bacteria) TaxID=1885016 RepID=UPI0026DFE579|nr:type II secretion system F family protein [Rothia sp. (in: high G+C Gram-positive bacteria)]MDO5749882.1 type II secretion system F family protein [Rothia sp. (in: high G+C Gram-positive bacteria)]